MTSGARVLLYDYKTHREKRVYSKFKVCGLGVFARSEIVADNAASSVQEDVYSGHFRSDGRLLVVGSSRGFVQALDVATKASLRKFQGHRGPVHVAQWAPDGGTHIVTAGDDRSVRCWDLTTGKGVATVEHAHDDYVRCGGSTPAAPNLWATGSYDHCVRLWDVRGLGGGGGGAPGAAGGGSLEAAVGVDEDDDDRGEGVAAAGDGEGEDDEAAAEGEEEEGGDNVEEEEEGEEADVDMAPVGDGEPAGRFRAAAASAASAAATSSRRGAEGGPLKQQLPRGCVLSVSHGEPVTQVRACGLGGRPLPLLYASPPLPSSILRRWSCKAAACS